MSESIPKTSLTETVVSGSSEISRSILLIMSPRRAACARPILFRPFRNPDATALPATIIDELKHILGNHAGESEVVLAIQTSAGPRTLRLGAGVRF